MTPILEKAGLSQEDYEALTPMMKQYLDTRSAYPDCILFYRLGDFYEMFFDDALTVSKELELTLTGKACGLKERAPMCGVPYHASESYLMKLISRGYKVAIGEQVEDPKLAKGLVKREVTRIVTPGTNLNMQSLDETRHNYLMCICYREDMSGIAVLDVSTGDFLLTQVGDLRALSDEISKFMPSEIVANDAFYLSGVEQKELAERYHTRLDTLDAALFDEERCKKALIAHFKVSSLKALAVDEFDAGVQAAGALMGYLQSVKQGELKNVTQIYPYLPGKFMLLDAASRRNLELTETIRDKTKRGSLLWVLDHTRTAMGARMLRGFIEQPLTDIGEMSKRQNAVASLVREVIAREEIREYLKPVYDLERLAARIAYRNANPRDLLAFLQSIRLLPALRVVLEELQEDPALLGILDTLDPLEDLCALIDAAIAEEAPMTLKEGGIIKAQFDADVDRLRTADRDGRQWLLDLEEETRNRTGIRTLRIKYSNNFGYAFEVSNAFRDQVPDDFVRRQTLTNCERYTNARLRELEDTIVNAREKLHALEYELFTKVRDTIASEIARINQTAKAIALLDTFQSLAYAAERYHYVQPELTESAVIDIRGGRHPVIEQMLEAKEQFIENDTFLDTEKDAFMIITGPNMAGKSTYMRQTALIVLMAQIGSFVPAKSATIGIADRIFTRVGASDDLASGRSTFMVEMTEVATILKGAGPKSFLILDEIGRGTSTYDGLAIARAVVEYIAAGIGARTMFATHYHELTSLEGTIPGIVNTCSTVKETEQGIVFLHKIAKGSTDRSYGIQVAKLAGVPKEVTDRAGQIAKTLAREGFLQDGAKEHLPEEVLPQAVQMSLFDYQKEHPVLEVLRKTDVNLMTPMDALRLIHDLCEQVRRE